MTEIPGNNLLAERFDGANNTAQNRDPARVESSDTENNFAFSLSNAVISLEANIARSLEIHGGAPSQGAGPAFSETPQSAPQQRRSDFSSSQQANAGGRETINAQQNTLNQATSFQNNNAQNATSLPTALQNISDQITNPSPSNVSPASSAISIATPSISSQNQLSSQNQTSTHATIRLDGQSSTNRAQTLLSTTDKAAPLGNPQATAAQESFARLISTRLANQNTQFDVRLDPPELGRVTLRFEAGEKASLNLSFEQQSTLDLFRRDTDALLSLLHENGIDTGDDFKLSFERAQSDQPDQFGHSSSLEDANHSYEKEHENFSNNQSELSSILAPLPEGLLYADHPLLNSAHYTDAHSSTSLLDIQV